MTKRVRVSSSRHGPGTTEVEPRSDAGTPVQGTWFGVEVPSTPVLRPHRLKAADPNPALVVFGRGPSDARCGTCARFVRYQHGRRRYGKCRLRGITHGEGTDHYASWPACGQYVVAPD